MQARRKGLMNFTIPLKIRTTKSQLNSALNKIMTTRWRNKGGGGGTALWQIIATSGYAHNKNPSLTYRPITFG